MTQDWGGAVDLCFMEHNKSGRKAVEMWSAKRGLFMVSIECEQESNRIPPALAVG